VLMVAVTLAHWSWGRYEPQLEPLAAWR